MKKLPLPLPFVHRKDTKKKKIKFLSVYVKMFFITQLKKTVILLYIIIVLYFS